MNRSVSFDLDDELARGQARLGDAMRAFIHGVDSELLDFLATAAAPEVFGEPMLFAHVRALRDGQVPVDLPQIVYGYLRPHARPPEIEVRSDGAGRVYLPGLGWFATDEHDASLVLHTDLETGAHLLKTPAGAIVAFRFAGIPRVPGTSIEIYRHIHPLLATIVVDRVSAEPIAVEFDGVDDTQLAALTRAIDLLARLTPALHREVVATVRSLCVFCHPRVHTCASIAAHGALLLHTGGEPVDEIFFVDALVHQAAHVAINAIAVDQAAVFTGDPHQAMGPLVDDPSETRTVLSCFHGFFTEMRMVEALVALVADGGFTGRQADELRGRLANVVAKLRDNAPRFGRAPLLRGVGAWLHQLSLDVLARVDALHPELAGLDLSNQPYAFSYAAFAERNPPAARGGA